MPTYQTRVLTARDRQLVDKLAVHPRYAALVERLTGGEPKPKPKLKPPKKPPETGPAPEPATTEPPEPEKPATGRLWGGGGHRKRDERAQPADADKPVPKPQPKAT